MGAPFHGPEGRKRAVRARAASIAYHGVSAILLILAGLPVWRGIAVAASPLVMEILKRPLGKVAHDGDEGSERSFFAMALSWQVLFGAILAVTGGIHSPMVAGFAMAGVLPTLLVGVHRIGARLAVSIGLIAIIVASLPTSIVGPVITTWHHHVIAVLTFAWAMFQFRQLTSALADVQRASAAAIDSAREERIRDAEAHTRTLQAVSARVAHELKNPLAVIKALVQLQARRARDDRERQQHDVMQAEIARMEVLLREYLSFARPFEDLEAVRTDLAEIVSDAAHVIAARAEHAGVELVVATRPSPIMADGRRLKHALLNLLSNALDATPRGGRVRVTCSPEDGGAQVQVSDSGRGIPADDLARIGTSFFTTRTDGTGLGVVTIVRVVAQHGGKVHYASAPGRGTTVTITLPAEATPLPRSIAALSTGPCMN